MALNKLCLLMRQLPCPTHYAGQADAAIIGDPSRRLGSSKLSLPNRLLDDRRRLID
jgi:hypothetical protein